MAAYNEKYTRLLSEKKLLGKAQIPEMAPLFGTDKMLEMDEDYEYLRYMYPKITREILSLIEDECDKMEYQGSPMFDIYPDRTTFRLSAKKILDICMQKNPEQFPKDNPLLRDLVEVLLYHEILFRRNRYRNRKRLYF